MSDYIIPESYRKPLLDLNRPLYPECAGMSDDQFEKFLLELAGWHRVQLPHSWIVTWHGPPYTASVRFPDGRLEQRRFDDLADAKTWRNALLAEHDPERDQ